MKKLVLCLFLFAGFHAPLQAFTQEEEKLLTEVQKQTYRYFYDFAHPQSAMARERSNANYPDYDTKITVTTGGSGFGFMATIVAVDRHFISRAQGVHHLLKAARFLDQKADKFHGIFPHWLNGDTGKTFAHWEYDDGSDLVETAFLFQGLLAAEQYFNGNNAKERELRRIIKKLWQNADWQWHTKGGENTLYWHWSPNHGFIMNHKIRGWDETLITYILAASSPTHAIEASVYEQGYKDSPTYLNGQSFYGYRLPLGVDFGGPLFWAHYSFLGLDPNGLTDNHTDYFEQNQAHANINHAHCHENPQGFEGYSAACWGLTASDIEGGYGVQSPTQDIGVLSPTAALASFPYTPEASMAALKCFMKQKGLWGPMGFKDAYNPGSGWVAEGYLAIDQGPIIVMIENYRTQLLWRLFMSHPDVQRGLKKLGFHSPRIAADV